MHRNSKIFLAGHRGLVGSAIYRKLNEKSYTNIITRTSKELDLRDQRAVAAFFEQEKPEYVILAAAKVGGILANNKYRAEFIFDNIQIQNNIIHQSYLNNVEKLLFLGSSCIYPKNSPQPMKEEYLLTDELEYTNEPYAISKIAGMKMCESYNIQYGTNFISVMPTNLYGPNDNYDLEKSHVLPALIRKNHLAKALMEDNWDIIKQDFDKYPLNGITGRSSEDDILKELEKQGISQGSPVKLKLWGTGTPRREFLHSDDMADGCVYLMEDVDFEDIVKNQFRIESLQNALKIEIKNTHINIGTGRDISINELASMIQRIVGFNGQIIWDKEKPDGTYQKLLNVEKLHKYGWCEKINLEQSLKDLYALY